jgi:type 2 lantibiotic biosynthesis protein LanM
MIFLTTGECHHLLSDGLATTSGGRAKRDPCPVAEPAAVPDDICHAVNRYGKRARLLGERRERSSMDVFYERLLARSATIDELLSDDVEVLPGQKRDADLAARRLAAWCRSCASGDWNLFSRRLARDGLSTDELLTRFATVRRKPSAPGPAWFHDAVWIEQALQGRRRSGSATAILDPIRPQAFEHLFTEIVQEAEERLWRDLGEPISSDLTHTAHACLRLSLLKQLSDLCTPAIYERFREHRNVARASPNRVEPLTIGAPSIYDQFILEMKAAGFRRLFEAKPVLLRLMALTVRQWIDTSQEFLLRLHDDLPRIRSEILQSRFNSPVCELVFGLSDPHNGGRSVHVIVFEDGTRVVYKPKDLRLDEAFWNLIARLNQISSPVELKAARTIPRDGYGWTEFVTHASCDRAEDCNRFFRRAGAWLALFHCFAATDMHQENLIAAADHPVPIDVEMILQPASSDRNTDEPERPAFEAAADILANSVMAVGLLPSYSRAVDHKVFAVGGLTPDWNSTITLKWHDINSDDMRPFKSKEGGDTNPNLPHVAGRYATFADHIDDFVNGFEEYARFLLRLVQQGQEAELFAPFDGLPVRKVIRPTRFYYMLLQRLKDHRSMDDGVIWSAQADFIARMADWESAFDPHWALQRAERSALLSLDVPYLVFSPAEAKIADASGWSTPITAAPGLSRALARIRALDEREIAWQVEVVRENTKALAKSAPPKPSTVRSEILSPSENPLPATNDIFVDETDRIAGELSRHAICRDSSAAWIGLDWLGDAEVFQLVCLGPTLYNGTSGIALFLAAHAEVRNSGHSRELALAGISQVRKTLRSRNAARVARSLGVGGAAGLGSIAYALTEISKRLLDQDVLADALVAAELISDELIAADKQLDVIGGSAGAILALLRLHRDTQLDDILKKAVKCGEHLIAAAQHSTEGGRSWIGQGLGSQRLTGISHGAAGFAYALASLFAVTGREEFAQAASECISFENSTYDPKHHNWPDFRGRGEPSWPCQWCHGAAGIGLARLATIKRGGLNAERMIIDVRHALDGAKQSSPTPVDTLCCGTLGNIEFFREAAGTLGYDDLRQLASQRLQAVIETARHVGDYRWNSGTKKFNLGLFRGLAGVGYTLLRQINGSLPNVLIWD